MRFCSFMSRLIAIVCVSLLLSHPVAPRPNDPTTCNIGDMATIGHKASKTACAGCYTFDITRTDNSSSANNFQVKISGPKPVKGLLVYAVDSVTGTRFGNFVNFPSATGPKSGCGGVGTNTLGHTSPTLKNMPFVISWNDAGFTTTGGKPWSAVFQGIVVVDYSDWYQIGSLTYTLGSGANRNSTSNSTRPTNSKDPSNTDPVPITTTVQTGASSVLVSDNFLFIAIGTTAFFWFSGNTIEWLLWLQGNTALRR